MISIENLFSSLVDPADINYVFSEAALAQRNNTANLLIASNDFTSWLSSNQRERNLTERYPLLIHQKLNNSTSTEVKDIVEKALAGLSVLGIDDYDVTIVRSTIEVLGVDTARWVFSYSPTPTIVVQGSVVRGQEY
jgi:hypothetical protein